MWNWIYRNVRSDGYENMSQVELIQNVREHFVNCFENNSFEIQWFLNFFDSYEACVEVFERMLRIMFPAFPFQEQQEHQEQHMDVANILADMVDLQNVENLEEFGDVIMVAEPV